MTNNDLRPYQLWITMATSDGEDDTGDYFELGVLTCRREDFDELSGINEMAPPPFVLIDLLENGNLNEDPIAVSVATALAVLPDVIARILRGQLAANERTIEAAA